MVCAHTDPQELLKIRYEFEDWLKFLVVSSVMLFPWEHAAYIFGGELENPSSFRLNYVLFI